MKRQGFTLIELLLVISIIAILAIAVFVALLPSKRLSDSRDAKRRTDVETVLSAIHSYIVDNGGALPTGLTAGMVEKQLGTATSGCTLSTNGCNVVATGACVDLSTPLAKYLKTIPIDPNATASAALTTYTVIVDSNGLVTVRACSSEGAPVISSSR